MTHTDKGNYGAKHQTTENLNSAVVQAVKNTIKNNAISCAAAHKITRDCSVTPKETGRVLDAQEIQITQCQLGIFKHSPDKPTKPVHLELTPELKKALTAKLVSERLPCAAAWSVAQRFGMTKPQIGAACDKLGIKINNCQLGTFG